MTVGQIQPTPRRRPSAGTADDALVGAATALAVRRLPMGMLVARADGRVISANDRVSEIVGAVGVAPATVAGYAALRWFRADGRRLAAKDWPLARLLAGGGAVEDEELTIVRPDGTPVAVLVTALPVADPAGRTPGALGLLVDVTAERQGRETRTFLAEAGALLGGSLEVDETADVLAHLAVPRIADWCSVELLEADGSLRQAALAHSNPERLELARELRLREPPQASDPVGLHAAIRERRPILVPEVPREALEDPRLDERERALVRSLALRSVLVIPLVAGEQAIGALNLVTAESGRRLGEEDLAFAEALGSRAAAAIQNARLVEDLRRFKALLDAIHEGVVVVDPGSRRIAYANHAAGALVGAEPDLLVGRPVETIAAAGARALRAAFGAVVARPGHARRVTLRIGSAGRERPVELSLQALASDQVGGPVVAIARDVGERIAAAERMRRLVAGQRTRAAELDAVIRAIGDGLVLVDAGGRIRVVNPAAEELLPGLDGLTWTDLVDRLEGGPDTLPAVPGRSESVELRRRGGDESWIEVASYPIGDGNGAIVVLRDVTAAHRRQVVRDTFIGILSHELRTPITTIYGAAKILARPGARSGSHDDLFVDIADESERLQRIVENLIALQRFGEDGGDIGREPVLLQRVLPAVLEAERAHWPGVELVADLEAGLPTVVADPVYLEQVVRNLVGNAAKYAGSGGPVQVTARERGDEVVVRVLDRGPGIGPDEAVRLFELYYRAPSTAGRAAGAGIGLFVCARLIGAMGGRIWAVPREGGGAEFGFALRVMGDGA